MNRFSMRFSSLPLGRKLTLAILGTTSLALFIGISLSMFTLFEGYRQSTMKRASGLAELMAAQSQAPLDFYDPETAQENFTALELVAGRAWVRLYDGDGNLFAEHGTVLPSVLDGPGEPQRDMGLNGLSVRVPVVSGGEAVGWLVLGMPLDEQWGLLIWQGAVSFLVLSLAVLLCLPVSRHLSRRITAPLARLGFGMEYIARNKDFSHRVRHEVDDEVGVLARQFNQMLVEVEKREQWLESHRELLEEMVEQRTRELMGKQLELAEKNRELSREIRERREAQMIREEVERINSHDLKSSLNLVIGYPELLRLQGGLTEQQETYLKRIESAGFRMLDLVKTQLDLFKMEQGIYRLKESEVDLVAQLCNLEEELHPLLRKSGVKLTMTMDGRTVHGDEAAPVFGEAALLATMLRNLLVNAVEASEPGDDVEVALMTGSRLRLSVRNRRPVPEQVRDRFFDKYVTHGKGEGTGLGTYSASLIARTHGAEITMRTGTRIGTVIRIAFPRLEQSAA